MKNLNFLSKSSSQSCGHSSVTLALTVGSPSVHRRSTMLKLISVLAIILTLGVGQMWGVDASAYKTATFTKSSFLKGVSGYNNTSFNSTTVGFVVNIANANNNNKGWDYIKIGGSAGAYTGTIITDAAIDKRITRVELAISAITSSKVTSIKLYKSTNKSTWSEIGTFDKSTGTKVVNISASNQAANLYYKIEAVCQKGSSNGLVTITGVKFYRSSFEVSYNSNGGSGTMTDSSSPYDTASVVTVKSNGFTAPNGKEFDGWKTGASSGTSYAPAATFTISANTTLYAQWVSSGPSCSNAVTLTKGSETNGTINSISSASVATCSETASDRRVTVTITPAACYNAPTELTWTKSSGTVTAAKQSGPTANGNGTYSYVYQFSQNDNGAGTFGVSCTAKPAGKTVNFDAGPGVPDATSLTETCDGSGITLPDVTATGVCKGWTTFAGWAEAAVNDSTTTSVTLYTAGSKYTPASDNMTLYAVYSKSKAGGTTPTNKKLTFGTSYASNASDLTEVTIFTGITASATNGTSNPPKYYTTSPGTWRMYVGSELTIASTIGKITQIAFTKSSDFSLTIKSGESGTLSSETWTYASGVNSVTFTVGGTTKLSAIEVTYQAASSATYYCSDPNCCIELGSINGSVSMSQNSATLEWADLDHVSSWAVQYKEHSAENWNTWNGAQATANSKRSVTITGLTCGTAYDFKIAATAAAGYCDAEQVLENQSTTKWNISYSLSNTVALSTGPAQGANACGDFSATFSKNASYTFPENITVQVGGATLAAANYTWNNTNGTLSIDGQYITGNVVVTIAGVAPANPIVTPNPAALSFDQVKKGAVVPAAQDIAITGHNLTAALTVTSSNPSLYAVSVKSGSLTPDGNKDASPVITVTPQAGITSTAGDKDATITISGGGLASNVVVNVTFNVQETYTVNWYVNGSDNAHKARTQTDIVGTDLTEIPSDFTGVTDCSEKVFKGWTETANYSDENDAPADLITSTTGMKITAANKNYYAVFADKEGEDSNSWDLVTSASSLQENDIITLTSTCTYNYSSTAYYDTVAYAGKNNTLGAVASIGITNNKIRTVKSGSISEVKLVGGSSSGKWKLYDIAAEEYLNDANKAISYEESGDDVTIAISDGVATITDGDYTLQYNPNNNAGDYTKARFAYYSSTQKAIQIYKKTVTSATYSNYVVVCPHYPRVTLSAAYSTTPANGSISFAVNSEAVTNVRTDGDDAVVDVVASPTTGYELTGLTLTSDDVTGATKNQALTQITIPEDEEGTLTVTATFAQKNYSIAVESYPASIGATLTGTTSTAKYGVEQTISTNEPTGYIFGGWYMYDAEDTGKETDLSPELFTGTYEGGDLELSASFLMPDRNLVAEAYFDKIYTPAEALALNDLSDSVFVEGIISQVDEVSTQYKNATYWISADGTTTNQIKIYRGKHLNNGDVTSSNAGQIAVGNKVIIRGKLSQNSNINQFGQGASYIYDLTEKVLSSIVVSAPDASLVKTEYFDTTETFSYAGLKATAEYNTGYQKDVTDDATWKANGSASLTVATGGTVNVTATYGGETSSNYGVAVTVTTKTLESITVSPAALTGYKGQALPKPTTVTANFDDQGVASSSNVTAQAVYDEAGDYSASSTSAQTIAVKYTFGPTTKSANYTVTLSSIENTLNTAYSVTEARAIIDLDQVEGNDLDLANNLVYVEGIITAKTTNEITIKDVTDATKTIVLYKSTLGTGISSVDVNDRIKALGVLKLYNNTKYEMDEDCEIVWKQPKVGITIANKTLEVGDVWTINATIDPAAAPVTYSIKDGSDDCVTLATNVITATAVGTATIVVTAEDYNEYLGNSKEFTVTVSPAKVHTDVIILAEYNGHYYALNNTAGTTEVQFENGMVIVPDQATKMAILWDRAEREGVATFYNAKASKFLNGGTSTTLGVATEEGTYTSWTWVETETKAYYTSNSGRSARTFMYMNGQSIKNYAVSNIGNGSYAQANVYAGAVAVKISSNTDVSDLPENASVLVEEGVTLTVDAASTLDNLIVENGGTVEVAGSNELTVVNNLTIQTTSGSTENQGKSGQLTGSVMPVVSGDLFIEIKLCEGAMDAEASRKWYCISAPFNVNMNGGFFWGDGTQMVLNTDFQLFEWDGDRRATGISGWKRVSGVMKAGIAYFIGFDDERSNQNIIKLKATNKTISNKSSINAPEHSSSVDDKYANWNGLANPNFRHIALNKDVQAFDHNIQAYTTYGTGDYNFVVGTPFFIKETGDITIEAADNSSFRAPKREVEQLSYCVRIVREGKAGFDNQMYVRASEEASTSYEEGHDLVTMNAETSNYGALLWTVNYGGKRLAIEEAPLVNDKASYALSLYAPADGAYRIETPTVREDASLYLTYEGNIIWDLSAGAYELELNKGATEGYGLMLVRKAPQVTTGVENVQGDKIQCTKVILNDHVYILRDAQLYDVTGKAVK